MPTTKQQLLRLECRLRGMSVSELLSYSIATPGRTILEKELTARLETLEPTIIRPLPKYRKGAISG